MVATKSLSYRVWGRISRRRSIWGWVVFGAGGGWAALSAWSTGEFALGKLDSWKPILSTIWGNVWSVISSVKPYWYQAALILGGLVWIAFVASRPEPPEQITTQDTDALKHVRVKLTAIMNNIPTVDMCRVGDNGEVLVHASWADSFNFIVTRKNVAPHLGALYYDHASGAWLPVPTPDDAMCDRQTLLSRIETALGIIDLLLGRRTART